MNIVDSTMINVLNYTDGNISIPTQIRPDGYLFEPTIDDQPFAIPLSFTEIRIVNSQSNIFREGNLRFDSELEKDVYEKLGIRDWENIMSDSQIRDIILHPTKEGLEKLIKITSASMFERVRGMLVQLDNSGMYDISVRVKNVISERYKELYVNKRISDIKVVSTLAEKEKVGLSDFELAKIKEELRAQLLEEMKSEVNATVNASNDNQESTTVKKPGRPPATK